MRTLERSLLAVLAATTSASKPSSSTSAPYLNNLAQAAGKLWFGTAMDTTTAEPDDVDYMTVFNDTNIFGQVTPGNTMKWEFTEPTQNETIALAKATGKKVRCHNLVWSSELPSWVTDGSWTDETLLAAMETHIKTEIEYYGSGCWSWDVVNEALDSNGGLTSNVQSLGEDIKLFYNDYSIEWAGTKNTAAIALVQEIQGWDGAHIDGIGFESHYSVSWGASQAQQEEAMASFTALGLQVHITELDVPCTAVLCTTDALATQAQIYYDTISACMNTEDCTDMTVWDFDDKYSWIQPADYDGEGDPDLYYSDLTRHPAYTAVAEAIQGLDCSVC
ncbi:hypothetical protein N7488_005654 [Penicillium malachiteum]|nr:hypothetical protein N7488_005654 [Penicillium malachiteum]